MQPLRGIVPPLITPLLDQEQLDPEHLEKLLEYVLAGGVHGLFLFGTTGEAPSISRPVKLQMTQRTCRLVQGRVPVLVNVSDTSLAETLLLAKMAADAGATALFVTVPYYFPIEQADLWLYLQKLASALPLPFLLYNIPSHTRVGFALETMQRALDLPQIIGIKDSSGNRAYLHQLIALGKQRADWSVFVGQEELLVEAMQSGAQGGILAGGNLYPRLLVELHDAALRRDAAHLPDLNERLAWFHQHVFRVCAGPNGWLVGLKTTLALQGLCREVLAEPLHPATPLEHQQLERNCKELNKERDF